MRDRFLNLVLPWANWLPIKLLIRLSGIRLLPVFYHGIANRSLPHVSHLYKVKTYNQFEKDIMWLSRHFKHINHNRLVKEELKPEFTYFNVSFDDGLSQVMTVTPILLVHGVLPTIFVNSSFVDNKSIFFRYKQSLLINTLKDDPKKRAHLREKYKVDSTTRWILKQKGPNNPVLDEIAKDIGFDFGHFLSTERPYLTKAELQGMEKIGFIIGAHSANHPYFSDLNTEEQINESLESLEFIKDNFNQESIPFAFPFTDYKVKDDFFSGIRRAFPALSWTWGSAGLKREKVPMHLQRISLERNGYSAEHIIKAELLYYIILRWLRMSYIKR